MQNISINNVPLISIVMPTYNSSKYLSQTLDSIHLQTDDRWECVLVDDGSTDSTMEISRSFSRLNPRFRHSVRNPKSKGANACRNAGIQHCRAKHILFMDADDLLGPNCIKMRIDILLKHSNYDLLIFNTCIIDEDNKVIGSFSCLHQSTNEILCAFIRHQIQWQTMSPLWKKEFLEKIGCWNEAYMRLQDVELNIRAMLNQPEFKLIHTAADSFYRLTALSGLKIKQALYGFVQLIKDLNFNLINKQYPGPVKTMMEEAFVDLIEGTIKFYIHYMDTSDLVWTNSFLEALQNTQLNETDIEDVKEILNAFNNDDQS